VNVIFQTAEDGLADTIKPRLEQLGADCSRVHVIDEEDEALSLYDERIEQAIIKTNAKLFILDPLQAYLGGTEMNSANGIRPLMKSLGAVAERTGCAIVIIGHLNKKGGKSAYRGLGSIDIPAAARSVLTVGRLVNVDENMRAFIQTKSNLAPTGMPQAFGLDPVGGFCWLGDYNITIEELLDGKRTEEKGASQLDLAKAFIKGLLANGDVLSDDVFKKGETAGFPEATMKRAKSDLKYKSVKRGNVWYWTTQPNQEYQEVQQSQKIQDVIGNSDGADTLDTLDTLAQKGRCDYGDHMD
jgi:hypothetical protein